MPCAWQPDSAHTLRSGQPVWRHPPFKQIVVGHVDQLQPSPSSQRGQLKGRCGILPILERQLWDASGESMRQKLEKFLELVPFASCQGLRLKPEALAVRVGPYRIHELTSTSVGESLRRIEELMGVGAHEGDTPLLSPRQIQIGDLVLREIRMRLKFLLDVGLD